MAKEELKWWIYYPVDGDPEMHNEKGNVMLANAEAVALVRKIFGGPCAIVRQKPPTPVATLSKYRGVH